MKTCRTTPGSWTKRSMRNQHGRTTASRATSATNGGRSGRRTPSKPLPAISAEREGKMDRENMKSQTIYRQGKRQTERSTKIGQRGDRLKNARGPLLNRTDGRKKKRGKKYTGANHGSVGKQKSHIECTLPHTKDYTCRHTVNLSGTQKNPKKRKKPTTLGMYAGVKLIAMYLGRQETMFKFLVVVLPPCLI